jgi:hypothetical protein
VVEREDLGTLYYWYNLGTVGRCLKTDRDPLFAASSVYCRYAGDWRLCWSIFHHHCGHSGLPLGKVKLG